jgi:hypothetical protein
MGIPLSVTRAHASNGRRQGLIAGQQQACRDRSRQVFKNSQQGKAGRWMRYRPTL